MPQVEAPENLAGNYFVSTYPPFFFWSERGLERFRARLEQRGPSTDGDPASSAAPFGLYLHLPFCAERCHFCYYMSHAGRQGDLNRYIEALLRELALYVEQPSFMGRSLSFVYFGGGTPSLLSISHIRKLFGGLQSIVSWDGVREVTFECAPQSVTPEKMQVLQDAGVTRLSMGVQQLDDEVLKLNGRVHQVRDVERAWEAIRGTPFEVVNLDLIVGLVGETDASFHASLASIVLMAPESVTIYQLEIPHNTPLYRALRDGTGEAPASWEVKRERLKEGFARLEAAGYTLRSAYTAVRDPARHHFIYQDEQYRGADLLGLGASAFSYLDGINQQNVPTLDVYLERLAAGRLPLWRAYPMDDRERLVREVVLQMKLGGLEAAYFRKKFGVEVVDQFAAALGRFAAAGWVTQQPDGARLTRGGLLRVDRLLPELYLPEHRGSRYS